jgi:hypothetical protein
MKKLDTQPIMKFIHQAGKTMFFNCPTQESIPNFLLPTKWAKIFGETLKTVVA